MTDNLTPKAIVRALDLHIIGQGDAKKAVAVALRNRWRRQRLSAELRDEVTPKNILMIGPTGCGKTEISRRLAKLADAPFVKVEATKFTEVGYVGRDVEQIARDLVEEAIRLEKDRRREAVREAASKAAMDRLLKALVGESASEATRESFRQRIVDGLLLCFAKELLHGSGEFEVQTATATLFPYPIGVGDGQGGTQPDHRRVSTEDACGQSVEVGDRDAVTHRSATQVGAQAITDIVSGSVGERRDQDATGRHRISSPQQTLNPQRECLGLAAACRSHHQKVQPGMVADLELGLSRLNHVR